MAAKSTTERITESFSRSSKVDRAAGVIRDVKLIGFKSKNNRSYPPGVLRDSVHVYEGAKVNLDHPERDAAQPRKYSERFGVIRSARFVEGQGVFGDFHFNPKHPLAEQVLWMLKTTQRRWALATTQWSGQSVAAMAWT